MVRMLEIDGLCLGSKLLPPRDLHGVLLTGCSVAGVLWDGLRARQLVRILSVLVSLREAAEGALRRLAPSDETRKANIFGHGLVSSVSC